MRAFFLALLAASGTALVTASALPASAQLARPQTVIGVTGGNDLVTEVQWRRGWRGGKPRRPHVLQSTLQQLLGTFTQLCLIHVLCHVLLQCRQRLRLSTFVRVVLLSRRLRERLG